MQQEVINHLIHRRNTQRTSVTDRARHNRLGFILSLLVLLVTTSWAYWRTIKGLFYSWQSSNDYSAGQLVPLLTIFLIWRKRKKLSQFQLKPSWWGGIAILILGEVTLIYGWLFLTPSVRRYALVITMSGLVLMIAGRQVYRHVSWILLLLIFMVPLPRFIHNMISGPLQMMATTGAVFLVQVFGTRISQEGNIVTLNENTSLGIVEACSGLRMLMAFIIVTAFIACMVKRSRLKKAILILSSIPIAVICNIFRIFITAMLILYVSEELGEKFFHDFAGLVMMPIAVSLIFSELWLMDRLVVLEPGPR
ncbi:MAG: exosortase/archaeosortase family protein [Planctomycetes bacterium]|nr:exosortase/archaeosortase family protein [Planctomycetota bacterium]